MIHQALSKRIIQIILLCISSTYLLVVGCGGGGSSSSSSSANSNSTTTTYTSTIDFSSVLRTESGVITNLIAQGTGGGSPFDGEVDETSDLDDLAETAWGDGALDLHRGHAPIESVLEIFLGISHTQMHAYMEQQSLNLSGVAQTLGLSAEDLIDTLTWSFVYFLEQGVDNGVITEEEALTWALTIRNEFSNRVYWTG